MNPLVSIIIPTYNRADTLPRAIDSVLGQSYDNLELIIVDDGSTDNTKEVVKSYDDPRIRYIKLEKNSGAPVARNRGVDEAGGDYIAYLDSDDEFLPDRLERQLEEFARLGEDTGVVYSDWYQSEKPGEKKYMNAAHISREEGRICKGRVDQRVSGVSPVAALIKADFARKVGWDPKLKRYQDMDYFYQLARICCFQHLKMPSFIYYFRRTGAISTQGYNGIKARLYILNKYWEEFSKDRSEMWKHLRGIDYVWSQASRWERFKGFLRMAALVMKGRINRTYLGYIKHRIRKSLGETFGVIKESRPKDESSRRINPKYSKPRLRGLVASEAAVMKNYVSPGAVVLDAGCGDGRNTFMLVDELDIRLKLAAMLDYSSEAIGQARENITKGADISSRLFPVRGSVFELPFPESCFDAALALGDVLSLASAGGVEEGLWELARVTRPGGVIIFSLVTKEFLLKTAEERGLPEKIEEVNKNLEFSDYDVNYPVVKCLESREALENTMSNIGLEVADYRGVNIDHEDIPDRVIVVARRNAL